MLKSRNANDQQWASQSVLERGSHEGADLFSSRGGAPRSRAGVARSEVRSKACVLRCVDPTWIGPGELRGLPAPTHWTCAFLVGLLLLCCNLAAAGDPKEGKKVFRKCQPCHSLDPGETRIGPSLAEVFGRKSGVLPGFEYSEAMKSANITWNAESLEKFLADTQGFVPGNRMPFTGLLQKHERDDVIAYLRQASAESAKPAKADDGDTRKLSDARGDVEETSGWTPGSLKRNLPSSSTQSETKLSKGTHEKM